MFNLIFKSIGNCDYDTCFQHLGKLKDANLQQISLKWIEYEMEFTSMHYLKKHSKKSSLAMTSSASTSSSTTFSGGTSGNYNGTVMVNSDRFQLLSNVLSSNFSQLERDIQFITALDSSLIQDLRNYFKLRKELCKVYLYLTGPSDFYHHRFASFIINDDHLTTNTSSTSFQRQRHNTTSYSTAIHEEIVLELMQSIVETLACIKEEQILKIARNEIMSLDSLVKWDLAIREYNLNKTCIYLDTAVKSFIDYKLCTKNTNLKKWFGYWIPRMTIKAKLYFRHLYRPQLSTNESEVIKDTLIKCIDKNGPGTNVVLLYKIPSQGSTHFQEEGYSCVVNQSPVGIKSFPCILSYPNEQPPNEHWPNIVSILQSEDFEVYLARRQLPFSNDVASRSNNLFISSSFQNHSSSERNRAQSHIPRPSSMMSLASSVYHYFKSSYTRNISRNCLKPFSAKRHDGTCLFYQFYDSKLNVTYQIDQIDQHLMLICIHEPPKSSNSSHIKFNGAISSANMTPLVQNANVFQSPNNNSNNSTTTTIANLSHYDGVTVIPTSSSISSITHHANANLAHVSSSISPTHLHQQQSLSTSSLLQQQVSSTFLSSPPHRVNLTNVQSSNHPTPNGSGVVGAGGNGSINIGYSNQNPTPSLSYQQDQRKRMHSSSSEMYAEKKKEIMEKSFLNLRDKLFDICRFHETLDSMDL